ncbi:MAG: hypothetical protein KF866_09330 [Phycisphaeraceae bacterium]|nr:hypothetical protein [Phycisphaeraceae bacterium]
MAIFSGLLPGRMASDQLLFHEVTVRVFAEQFPKPNLADYRSATSPGYHLVLAAVDAALGLGRSGLQLAASGFTAGFLGLLVWVSYRAGAGRRAALLCAPLLASLYVWPAGVWLLPDNAGWLGVVGVLALAFHGRTVVHLVAAGVVLAALVWMRQIHLWAAAVIWMAGWLGPDRDASSLSESNRLSNGWFAGVRGEFLWLLSAFGQRMRRAAIAGVCTLPAFGFVAWFAWKWGGLTPPLFAEGGDLAGGHQGMNPAAPAFVLALLGLFTPFFAGVLHTSGQRLVREAKVGLVAAALAGAAIAAATPTSYDKEAGRWTGLWNIVQKIPAPMERSPVIIALAAAGAVALVLWCAALSRRDRWLLLTTVAGFSAAMTATHELWQRYVEPLVLIVLVLASSRAIGRPGNHIAGDTLRDRAAKAWCSLGPIVLAGAFAVLTTLTILKSDPIDPARYDEALDAERTRQGMP